MTGEPFDSLSILQRVILLLGWRRRRTFKSRPRGFHADVYRAEVFDAYYGWPYTYSQQGNMRFSRREIGPRRYNAAQVAVTKAMQRLQKRGLIQKGVNRLTDKGRAVAEAMWPLRRPHM